MGALTSPLNLANGGRVQKFGYGGISIPDGGGNGINPTQVGEDILTGGAAELGGGKASDLFNQGTNAAFGSKNITRPQLAPLQQVTTPEQVQQAQTGVGNSLQSQQALLQALQAQGGLGLQNTAVNQQQALANQLAQANGVGAQTQALQGLQGAAGQYQNIASGQGPNPAMAALNERTGQNVANQAALMAGQRGASANAGLLARQAAQAGGALQQQAVGQGATMQANQQLNALQGLVGAQQAAGGLGSGLTAQQQAANAGYANQANQIAGQQIGATGANTQANMANLAQQQGALAGMNNANIANQGSVNSANAGIGQAQIQGQQKVIGGLGQGAGALLGLAGGGEVQKMAEGGAPVVPAVTDPVAQAPITSQTSLTGPKSSFGKFLSGFGDGAASPSSGEDTLQNGVADLTGGVGNKFKKKPATSYDAGPGEDMAGEAAPMTEGVAVAAKGGLLAKTGGHVTAKKQSQKPVKSGNSYSNDKVPAMLSAGEIVLPRSVTMSKDPVRSAADFVQKVLAKKRAK